jgi:hypothetical protein
MNGTNVGSGSSGDSGYVYIRYAKTALY